MWICIPFLVFFFGKGEGRWDWETMNNQSLSFESWLTKLRCDRRSLFPSLGTRNTEGENASHLVLWVRILHALRWPQFLFWLNKPCKTYKVSMLCPWPVMFVLNPWGKAFCWMESKPLNGASRFPRMLGFLSSSWKVLGTLGGIHSVLNTWPMSFLRLTLAAASPQRW